VITLKEEILADQSIRQIRCNLAGIYFGWRPNNEFVWGEVNELNWREINLSSGITTEMNKTAW